jgi:phosphatidylglycerophosphatase A
MISFHRMFAGVLGIGYIPKGGGTVAALACCICWYGLQAGHYHPVLSAGITAGIILVGTWSAGKMETVWGRDNHKIVIDEVAGMCVSLLWIPVSAAYLLLSFVLFRFFDIAKPLMIRRAEKLPGGWGVMADDLLAGFYTNLVLQTMILTVKECSHL